MREAFVFLLLTFTLLQHPSHTTARRTVDPDERPGIKDHTPLTGDTFLDSLVEDSDDVIVSTFGLETLQGLHSRKLQCAMNVSTLEMEFNKKMTKLLKYYRSMESLISVPDFAEFSNEDRPSVEANFHRTIRHAERMRDQQLKSVIASCERDQDGWLRGRFLTAVEYSLDVLENDLVHYREIIAKVEAYKLKLERHLWHCDQQRQSVFLMYCYGEELVMLLQRVDDFLFILRSMINEYYVDTPATTAGTTTLSGDYYGDDEDLVDGSGMDHEDYVPATPTPKHVTPPEAPSATTPPSTSRPAASSTTELSIPTQTPEISVSGSQEGGNTTSEVSSTTTVDQAVPEIPWLEQTFEQVEAEVKDKSGGRSHDRDSGSRKTSKTKSRVSGEVEVNGDEVDVRIDIGSEGDQVFQDIFLDPASPTPQDEGEGWSYTTYILCFFLLMLGAIIILFVIVTITLLATRRARRRHKGGVVKDPPILSDQDTLDVMKKTGYVNPTYKFYTQS